MSLLPASRSTETAKEDVNAFFKGRVSKKLLLLNGIMALVYFFTITFGFRPGNHLLFYLLIAGEVFHVYQILGYLYTIWDVEAPKRAFKKDIAEAVDVFITVAGEPVDIVRETAVAVIAMDYPNFKVHILNDGYVAKRDNWKDIIALADELGINCITRKVPGGAKAGNINNGLRETEADYFVVFDADHVPYPSFLRETMGYMVDPKVALVQTPQYYKNHAENTITQVAWDQQTLFFGPILSGKNRLNSTFMCGTNMTVRRAAVDEAGGMCETNIAEDFLTTVFIHQKHWKSVYVPKVLAEGLAPEDFLSYYKQQFRWTRGSLEVIFKYNPLVIKGFSFKQRIQYLVSASYFLSGVVVLIDALLPVIFLYTGITAVNTATMTLAAVFIPYIFLTLYVLQKSNNFKFSFNAIAFSISSFWLQISALYAVLTRKKTVFAVTSKQQLAGNYAYLTIPQIIYVAAVVIGVVVGLHREGLSASLMANLAWALVNTATCIVFILASLPQRQKASNDITPPIQPPALKDLVRATSSARTIKVGSHEG